ncbi:unnamed protein product [Lota lota]
MRRRRRRRRDEDRGRGDEEPLTIISPCSFSPCGEQRPASSRDTPLLPAGETTDAQTRIDRPLQAYDDDDDDRDLGAASDL